jgi:hypothetical protein
VRGVAASVDVGNRGAGHREGHDAGVRLTWPLNNGVGSSTDQGDRKRSPVVFALDRLFPKHGKAPYATTERVVVLAVIRAMSFR